MRWPWRRKGPSDQLIVSWSGQTLAYVLARSRAGAGHDVLKFGVVHQGTDSMADLVHQLQDLGLKGHNAQVMLLPEQYQLLQIDAPAVPPEELRAAARYQIKEMIDSHIDDVTLDVMRVGDGTHKGAGHLFVVAVTNAVVRVAIDLGNTMHWAVSVIDIQETSQRNLQNALAALDGHADRANVAIVLQEGHQVVLTISANEELFYTRRFELPVGFLTASWGSDKEALEAAENSAAAFMPVGDYVPDYSVGGVSYGNDYSNTRVVSPASGVGASSVDEEKAQRFVVEVQRSLDVWSRSWSSMPLDMVRVYAGERSDELATWLGAQLGQTVLPMKVEALFAGFEGGAADDRALCLPLLGVLMRTENRKL